MMAALDYRDEGVPPVALVPVPASRWQMDYMWSKVRPTITCWLWTGVVDCDGYGKYGGRGAHLVVWERLFGCVTDGLELDHLCQRRNCVNPGHLEPVTPAENRRRRQAFSDSPLARSGGPGRPFQTHCAKGHEFTPENTVMHGTRRRCRACQQQRNRTRIRNRVKNRAAAEGHIASP